MVEPRPLAVADLPGCLALSTEAGWNQTEADWRLILRLGIGRGLFEGQRLIATTSAIPYGDRFGWVCMVLVAVDRRRNGHATSLIRWVLQSLDERGLLPGLDATQAGREVYRRLGFGDIYGITRLHAKSINSFPPSDFSRIRPMRTEDIEAVSAYDAAAFGAERSAVIAALHKRRPDLAVLSEVAGRIEGYLLARDGRMATQIGPVVANDKRSALQLLSAAFSNLEGPVFIDLADHHAETGAWLAALGFHEQRRFTRMLAGRDVPFDDPERIVAIAGPELS
jgi:GNAT superfamily N-acetyltransferase